MQPPTQETLEQPQTASGQSEHSGRSGRSLWREFGRLLLLVGLVPSLVICAALLWTQARQERQQLGERVVITSRLTATSIDDYLQGHLAGVSLLASMPPDEAADWPSQLQRTARLYPALLNMLVTDATGRVREVFPRQPLGNVSDLNVSDRAYFRVPRDTGFGYVSDAFRGRGRGTDPLVAVSAPIVRNGRFDGVVEGSIKINAFSEFRGVAMHSRGYELVLLDRQHRVVYASPGLGYQFLQVIPPAPDGATDVALRVEGALRSGANALLAETPMRNGWTLRILVSEASLQSALRRNVLLVLGLMTLLVGGVLAASLWQMRMLANAMDPLVQRMRRIAVDQELQSIDVSTLPVELVPLAEALNHSSAQLAEAYCSMSRSLGEQRRLRQSLEDEVGTREREIDQRTRELRDAVAELDRLSSTDALTGCLNRRGLEDRLHGLRARSRDEGQPVALLALDIDHFKDYNDRYGHPAGDSALRRFVGAMRSALYGADDLISRVGGEEFIVALPGGDIEVARSAAERIRKAVRDAGIPHAGEQDGVLAVSIGVAIADPEARDGIGTAMQSADDALYRAKREGRNRVAG